METFVVMSFWYLYMALRVSSAYHSKEMSHLIPSTLHVKKLMHTKVSSSVQLLGWLHMLRTRLV